MEMLLMGICVSVFGIAIACAAFGAAVRPEDNKPEGKAEPRKAVPARFFVTDVAIPASGRQVSVPIEALLLQLERHVRLETAAAESFLAEPTPAQLHSKTISPFLN